MVPVEVVPFAVPPVLEYLKSLGVRAVIRQSDSSLVFETDQRNNILDVAFGPTADPYELDRLLKSRAGVVEHGLFLDIADEIIVAGSSGIRHLSRLDHLNSKRGKDHE